MSKLTASQDICEFLVSANKVEALESLELPQTNDLVGITLIADASDNIKGYIGNIQNSGFINQETLKGLSLGSSVTSIGQEAFADCPGFSGSLTIPNSVASIGLGSFCFCYGFNKLLTIGNSVTSIGSYAFYNCNGFTGININRATAPTIGVDAFAGMDAVSPAVIHVPVGATGYAASYNGLTVVKDL